MDLKKVSENSSRNVYNNIFGSRTAVSKRANFNGTMILQRNSTQDKDNLTLAKINKNDGAFITMYPTLN